MMSDDVWSKKHEVYKEKDWIDKPSIFAQEAIAYFPKQGKVLELGAGQGQDSRYFASMGYKVVSTDFEEGALEKSRLKLTEDLRSRVSVKVVDLREQLPFKDASFDVVYAHLSLHYFDKDTTERIFHEISRVLRKDGVLAFLVNSTSDPEYNTGAKLESNYFMVDRMAKRYFDIETVLHLTEGFAPLLADDSGETYKDRAKGIHNLIRFIGRR